MQVEKKEEHHFDPYVRLEVLESERRLEKQIHELEIKMLNGFSNVEKSLRSSFRWYFGTLTGLMGIGFAILAYLQK